MLKQRILTALVLLLVLVVALTVGRPLGFPLFALVTVGVVIGEWLLLLGHPKSLSVVAACATMAVLWIVDASSVAGTVAIIAWVASALAWIALSASLFATGRFPSSDRLPILQAALALLVSGACWFALVAAYREGLVHLLSILAIVWAADIAAYFAGRAFGKRKLAPAISPGKTWAGAIGGAVAVLVLAVACIVAPALSDSYFAVLGRRWPIVAVLGVALVLVALSVVGDLFESQLKRTRGVKDSGTLLPGHGGVFDRVDALLPIVPVALLLRLAA